MRILVTAFLALSVLTGIAAPVSAFDAKSLFGPAKRTLIDKIGFAFQLRSLCHFEPPLCYAYIIKATGIRFKPLFRS